MEETSTPRGANSKLQLPTEESIFISILQKLSVVTAGAAMVAVGALSVGEAQAITITGSGYTATDEILPLFDEYDISDSGTIVLKKPGTINNDAAVPLLNLEPVMNF